MEFTTEQNAFINDYVAEINNGGAAIFAGAGLSAKIGFVNWKELLRDLAKEIGLDIDKEHDYATVAQYHYNKYKRGKINHKIVNEFTTLKSVTRNHQFLAKLDIGTFWTTNYDQLIEKSLEQEGKMYDLKVRNKDFSHYLKKKNATVYKMHGDKNSPDEAVLIKDDYDLYNNKREFFTTALKGDLLSKMFLFVGFSFDDPNIDYILSRIKVLLEDSPPTHYCFFKKIKRADFKNKEKFLYAQVKQQLKTDDLLRYGIHVVPIDDYSDITSILEEIHKRVLRRNVFISGAAADYSPMSENDAIQFVHRLSYKLAEKNYKIVSGYGLGIGSIVINGALDYKLNSDYRNIDDLLVLRPFPQIQSGEKTIDEIYNIYRQDMLSKSGVAIFLYGNRRDEKTDKIVDSRGMFEEFEICLKNNVIPIPVGRTGYASQVLWSKVTSSLEKYYPKNKILQEAILKLNDSSLGEDELIQAIITAIDIAQNS